MTLVLGLGPTSFPRVPRIHSVHVVYESVKRTMIPAVESELDSRDNVFGDIYGSDVLQYYQLKNYHPLCVPLPILYAVKLH